MERLTIADYHGLVETECLDRWQVELLNGLLIVRVSQ